jgi:ribose transport system substrate-binding protein
MKLKKVLLIGLILMAVCGLAFAGPGKQSSGGLKIGVSIADQKNPFYLEILDGMKAAMRPGDQLIPIDAEFRADKQMTDIETLIQDKVDIILIDPVDSKGIQGSLLALQKAKIPIITYNSAVEDKALVKSNIATDNFMAGQLIGEALGKELNGTGTVVMLTYNIAEVCLDRANGFKDAIKKYPGIRIAAEQELNPPGVDTGLNAMENMLQAYPNVSGVFALNDPSAIGAASACESAKKLASIKIVGVDGSTAGIEAIKAGRLLASAAQDPVAIGRISVETAYKVLQNQSVQADVKVPTTLVTKNSL